MVLIARRKCRARTVYSSKDVHDETPTITCPKLDTRISSNGLQKTVRWIHMYLGIGHTYADPHRAAKMEKKVEFTHCSCLSCALHKNDYSNITFVVLELNKEYSITCRIGTSIYPGILC